MDIQAVIISILVVLGIIGVQVYRYYQQKKKDQPVQQRIDAYRKSGQVLMQEHEIPLTERESARIRSRQGWLTWGGVFIVVIILLVFACIFAFGMDINIHLVNLGFLILSVAWIYYSYQYHVRVRDKIATSTKTIVRGIITNKYEDNDETSTYYLVIDKLELVVDRSVYKTYQLGDAVEFHIFKPYYNMVLQHSKLEGAGLRDSVE